MIDDGGCDCDERKAVASTTLLLPSRFQTITATAMRCENDALEGTTTHKGSLSSHSITFFDTGHNTWDSDGELTRKAVFHHPGAIVMH